MKHVCASRTPNNTPNNNNNNNNNNNDNVCLLQFRLITRNNHAVNLVLYTDAGFHMSEETNAKLYHMLLIIVKLMIVQID